MNHNLNNSMSIVQWGNEIFLKKLRNVAILRLLLWCISTTLSTTLNNAVTDLMSKTLSDATR